MPRNYIFSIFLFLFFSTAFFSKGQIASYETKVKIEKGKKITEKLFIININSRDDQHLADIKIEFQGSREFKLLEASVIDSQGETVRKLKKRNIKTRSNLSYTTFYNDGVVKEFELHWNSFPYQIKYAYRIIEDEFVSVAGWNPVFESDITVQKASLQVEIPLQYQILMDFSDQLNYTVHEEEGVKSMHWEIRNFEPPEIEMFAPHVMETIPTVTIFPKKFKYGIEGRSDSWASFGKWFDSLNEGSLSLTVMEKIKIDQLIKDIVDQEEIVKTLYHYLQDNVRYVNVRLDIGGLKSYPAEYVCKKKYGDCKALTTYMKALLNHAGISSDYVLINGGFKVPRINPGLPGQQFNHTILCVPLGKDTLWLENTSGIIPFNYQGAPLQNRKALLINKDSSQLVTMPAMDMDEVYEERIFVFELDKDGHGKVTTTQHLRGREFEKYRYYQKALNSSEQEQEIRDDLNIKHSDLISWFFLPADRDEHQFNILTVASCNNQFRQIGNMKIIQPPVFPVPLPENPEKRRNAVRVNIPVNKTDSMVYKLSLPQNYEIELPSDVSLNTAFGKYESHYVNKNSILTVVNKFQLFEGDYSKEVYDDFYSFFSEIEKIRHQSGIVITKKQ
jgi:hypothetical protein